MSIKRVFNKLLDFGYAYILRPVCAMIFSLYKVEIVGKENVSEGVPVVPCFIEGGIDRASKINIAPKVFKPLKMRFGKPLYFEKCAHEKMPNDVLERT